MCVVLQSNCPHCPQQPVHATASVNEVVSFTVHDTGEMRTEFTGERSGVVHPKLEWRTELKQTRL